MSIAFLITVDTEGDNLWAWKEGQKITTENALFIPRFQDLCEKYGFIPTYFTNYEMAMDDRWVEYGRRKQNEGKCEIGLHVHAWNSPPSYQLEKKYGGNSYITEYPAEIVHQKISTLSRILAERFGRPVTSARSGRWATNEHYFSALAKNGIFVDCSVTPAVDHSSLVGCSVENGNDYSKYKAVPSYIYPGVIELPMSTRRIHLYVDGTWKHKIKSFFLGDILWLRPLHLSQKNMETLVKKIMQEGSSYLEFMLHSSELMPEGNPYFKTQDNVERLYSILDSFFYNLKEKGFSGCSVSSYANDIKRIL